MSVGISASAVTVVSDANTAMTVKSGNLPVFGTPMMVALMEEAACNALKEANMLNEGQSSVGTHISVDHSAASPIGAKITATATITNVDGRKITLDLKAQDDKQEIGKGHHVRFIIDAERFMAKLK